MEGVRGAKHFTMLALFPGCLGISMGLIHVPAQGLLLGVRAKVKLHGWYFFTISFIANLASIYKNVLVYILHQP